MITNLQKENFLELGFFYKNYTDQLNVDLIYYIIDCAECVVSYIQDYISCKLIIIE